MEKQPEAGPELDSDIEEAFFGAVGRNEPRLFSTEFEPAMVILYKLHDDGWFWRLDSVQGGIICTVQKALGDPANPKTQRQTFQIGAPTIPLAICLAALRTRSK